MKIKINEQIKKLVRQKIEKQNNTTVYPFKTYSVMLKFRGKICLDNMEMSCDYEVLIA